MFLIFYCEWNKGLWDLKIILFSFYLHFTLHPNFFRTGFAYVAALTGQKKIPIYGDFKGWGNAHPNTQWIHNLNKQGQRMEIMTPHHLL